MKFLISMLLICLFLVGCSEPEYNCPPVYRAIGDGEEMLCFANPKGTIKAYIKLTDLVKLSYWLEQGGANLDVNMEEKDEKEKLGCEYCCSPVITCVEHGQVTPTSPRYKRD